MAKMKSQSSIKATSPSSNTTKIVQPSRLLLQAKNSPLLFQPAHFPEPLTIKPDSYTLIKLSEEEDNSEDNDEILKSKNHDSDVNYSPESKKIAENKIVTSSSSNWKYQHDPGSRFPSRIEKAWKSKRAPLGLINKGVTCYMNSAIQLLIHIPALTHYLQDVENGKISLPPNSVTRDFANLRSKLCEKSDKKKRAIYPGKLIKRLDDINSMLSEWNQEDAHEYFMSLMSRLHEDSTPKGQKLNTSIFYDIFGGLIQQTVICTEHKHISVTQQEFYDLSVPLDERDKYNKRYSLTRCISRYFQKDFIKVKNNEGYMCEKCNKVTDAIKTSSIEEFPEYLPIHVKRFKFQDELCKKIQTPLDYPSELDLSEYSTKPTIARYALIGLISHVGRAVSSGHYIAHIKQPNGTWALYDDELVVKVSENKALVDEDAYILLYSRIGNIGQDTYINKPVEASTSGSNSLIKSVKRDFDEIDNIFASAKRKKEI